MEFGLLDGGEDNEHNGGGGAEIPRTFVATQNNFSLGQYHLTDV